MRTYAINVIIYIYWIEIGGPNLKPIRWPYYSFMDNILFAIENHVSNQISKLVFTKQPPKFLERTKFL